MVISPRQFATTARRGTSPDEAFKDWRGSRPTITMNKKIAQAFKRFRGKGGWVVLAEYGKWCVAEGDDADMMIELFGDTAEGDGLSFCRIQELPKRVLKLRSLGHRVVVCLLVRNGERFYLRKYSDE